MKLIQVGKFSSSYITDPLNRVPSVDSPSMDILLIDLKVCWLSSFKSTTIKVHLPTTGEINVSFPF